MTDAKVAEPSPHPPLRLWPGVVGAALILLAALVGAAATEVLPFAMMAAVVAGLLIVAWWVLFSRAPWPDRLGAVVLMVAAVAAARRLLDPSIAGAGMGWLYYFLVIPGLGLALVAGAVLGRRLAAAPRRVTMAALILVACGAFALIRTGGTSGSPVDVHALDADAGRAAPRPRARGAATPAPGRRAANSAARGHLEARGATHGASRQRARGGCRTGARARRGARPLARLPGTPSRQRRPWLASVDRLGGLAARRPVAPRDRARLVVIRGRRRAALHPGAAR
jgi:hypothetical protein